jgi:N utilization substance protein B
LSPEPYTERLLTAVDNDEADIDQMIAQRLRGWTIERLPVLDLLVLRLAVAELSATDTPTGVVLSEAVDLASRYGTDESAKFVNGVLAAIAADVRPVTNA